MLKLLLVDDETPTKLRICDSVRWEELGISQIVQAEDGADALEKCAGFEPDILLTDVRMPVMDGVQLAARLIGKFPKIKIIFISGFTDKEYLKNAVKLGAVRYIEKPIQIDELMDALQTTADLIRNECRQQDRLRAMKLKEELESIEETAVALTKPKQEGAREEAACPENMRQYTMFLTIIVKIIGKIDPADAAATYGRLAELFCEIRKSFDLPNFHPYFTNTMDPMIIHLLCSSSGSNLDNYMAVSKFCSLLQKKASLDGMDTVMGVGEFVHSAEDLRASYGTASAALHQAFFKAAGCICYYKKYAKSEFEFRQNQTDDFADALSKPNSSHAILIISRIASDIKQYPDTPKVQVLRSFYSLARKLIACADENMIKVFGDVGEAQDVWVHINEFQFMNQLVDFLVSGVQEYYRCLDGEKYDNRIVKSIIKFIRASYNNPDLSIISISDYVNLSPTYICRIFKDTTGTTINNFILQCRMQKAQQLIKENKCKVNEIAKSVGYRNGNYFSFQFKKFTKYSPSQYREKVL